MKAAALVTAVLLACAAAPAFAQTAENPTVLNTPGVQFWNVYGTAQTNKAHKDKDVQGGMAVKVTIKPTENLWDVGAAVPITVGYKKGDHIVVAIYAKIVSDDPETVAEIPAVVQISSPPYTGIIQSKITLTTTWQLLAIDGVADADYAADKTNVALSLGGSAKTIELGPVFVLNEGQ